MNIKKVLYVDHGDRVADNYMYMYYGDMFRELREATDVTLYQGNPQKVPRIVEDGGFDCVVFGLGYFAQRNGSAYGHIPGLEELKVPVVCMLHKPQVMLEQKLSFFKTNNVDLIADVNISYKKFQEVLGIKTTRIWLSASPTVYHERDVPVLYDVGFSGATHANKLTGPTANLRDRVLERLKSKDIELFWNKQTSPSHRISSVEEYATKINESKIWIATTGPTLDISPRYFEVMLSKTLLFCNDMPVQYEGVFRDGFNCVTFKNDLSDFDDKLSFYLTNEDERNKIINEAYNHAMENLTSKHMCAKMLREANKILALKRQA